MVIKSAGPRTRYGWTSTVSRMDVMDLAGTSLALGREGLDLRNRPMILSMWLLISSGVDAFLLLLLVSE